MVDFSHRYAYRNLAIQALATLIISLFFLCQNLIAAYSALLGGLSVLLPSVIFAWVVLRHQVRARQSQSVLKNFYLAEALKFITMISLFTIAVLYVKLLPVPFLVTFVLLQVLPLFSARFIAGKQRSA